jgi:hypothetical protein
MDLPSTLAHQKMSEIQARVKAPKARRNNFGNYNYRSAEDILEAAKPILREFDASITLNDEPWMVGDWHYIKATVTVTFSDGSEVQSQAYAREPASKKGMDEAQVSGATSSYARKYALNGLFALDDGQDSDSMEPPKPITEQQVSYINEQLDKLPEDKAEGFLVWIHDSMGADNVADITSDDFGRVNSALKAAVSKYKKEQA